MDSITTIFSENIGSLYSNSELEKHYYNAKLCLLDYLSCLAGVKGTRLKPILPMSSPSISIVTGSLRHPNQCYRVRWRTSKRMKKAVLIGLQTND